MIKQISRFAGLLIFLQFLTFQFSNAQQSQPEMADIMRSNGKIYVVVAVLVAIFIGIVLYLIRIERKLKKLEKKD